MINLKSFLKLKYFIIIVLVVVLTIFGFQSAKGKTKKHSLKTAKAVKKDLLQTVSASGKIKADEEVTLKFKTSGRLAWVGVKKGDKVKKWQAIASLDKKELKKNLKKELLDYMDERWDFEQTNLDDYRDSVLTETIRRVKEKSQFDLDKTVLDVELADIALKYSLLITPINGIVTKVEAPYAGVNITPATAEFVISNPDKLIFSANIDEVDISKVKVGQSAFLVLDAYPEEKIKAKVSKIGFSSTTTTGGGTAFPVEFKLGPNTEDEKFKLGMNGDTEIIISQKKKVLTIPFEAVRENNDNTYVYVLKGKKPEKKQVKIGFSNDVDTEILSGLAENEMVVISGISSFKK